MLDIKENTDLAAEALYRLINATSEDPVADLNLAQENFDTTKFANFISFVDFYCPEAKGNWIRGSENKIETRGSADRVREYLDAAIQRCYVPAARIALTELEITNWENLAPLKRRFIAIMHQGDLSLQDIAPDSITTDNIKNLIAANNVRDFLLEVTRPIYILAAKIALTELETATIAEDLNNARNKFIALMQEGSLSLQEIGVPIKDRTKAKKWWFITTGREELSLAEFLEPKVMEAKRRRSEFSALSELEGSLCVSSAQYGNTAVAGQTVNLGR